MKKIFFTILIASTTIFCNFGQNKVGINTKTPSSTLEVKGSLEAAYKEITSSVTLTDVDYFVSYNGSTAATITLPVVVSGTGEYAGRAYHIKNISQSVLSVSASGSELIRFGGGTTDTKTFTLNAGEYAIFVKNANTINTAATWDLTFIGKNAIIPATDPTRFLGGSILVKLGQATGGTLPTNKLINGGSGTYSIGTLTGQTATAGGIMDLIGTGFTVSNPSTGIFDIKFDTPFTQIFGFSTNISDTYTSTANGSNPQTITPGSALETRTNTQIAFVNNNIIRIKTGDNNGVLSNRSLTFVVVGK